MDNFINLAKQGLASYENSGQDNISGIGGAHLNSPHHSGKTDGKIGPDIDAHEAVKSASKHADGSEDSSLFDYAMGFLSDNKDKHEDSVDEEHVIKAHDKAYSDKGSDHGLDANSLGAAAALQVLKRFTSGEQKTSGGGNTQTQLVGLAMSEAAKLFDTKGATSGNKQDAVNGAAMTLMKLFMQGKFSGSGAIGGGSSGGLSGLAAQFLK